MFPQEPQTIGEVFLKAMSGLIGTMWHMPIPPELREDWQTRTLAIAKQIALAFGAEIADSVQTRGELIAKEMSKCPCGTNGQHSIMPQDEAIHYIQTGSAVILSTIAFGITDYEEKSDLVKRTATLVMEMAFRTGASPRGCLSVEDGAKQIYDLYMADEQDDSILDEQFLSGAPDN